MTGRGSRDRFDDRDPGPSPEAFEPGESAVSGDWLYEKGRHRLLRTDRTGGSSAFSRTRPDPQAVSGWRGWRAVFRKKRADAQTGLGEGGAHLERSQPPHGELHFGRRPCHADLAGESGRAGIASLARAGEGHRMSHDDG